MLEGIKNIILKEKPVLLTEKIENILSWKELENLINLRPFVNSSRFKTVGEHPYSWENQAWLTDVNAFPPSLLKDVINERLCLIIDASKVNEKLNQICMELEEYFKSGAADAHLYFTLSDTVKDGFGIHFDQAHNLIVQVEGETKFRAWDIWSVKNGNVDSLPQEPIIDTILKPGDAAFIPRFYYHEATSITKRWKMTSVSAFCDVTNLQRHSERRPL